ncbi:MAG: hypothetical protein Fur005_44750 [Roseiflexaceae bacterium]
MAFTTVHLIYSSLAFLAAILCIGLFFYIRRQPGIETTATLINLNGVIGVWAFASGCQMLIPQIDWMLLWLPLIEASKSALGGAFLAFALQFVLPDKRRNLSWLLIFLPATMAYTLCVTNDWHEWWYRNVQLHTNWGLTTLGFTGSPAKRMFQSLNFLAFGYGLIPIIRTYRHVATRRRGLFRIILAWVLIEGSVLGTVRITEAVLHIPPSPFVELIFLLSAPVVIVGALLRIPRLGLLPMARSRLFEEFRDGFLVLDQTNQISDLNLAAARIFQRPVRDLLLANIHTTLPNWPDQIRGDSKEEQEIELVIEHGSQQQIYEIHAIPIYGLAKQHVGVLVRMQDVTEQIRARQSINATLEQEQRRVSELQALQQTLVDISSKLDLDPLLNLIVQRIVELTEAESGILRQYDPHTSELNLLSSYRLHEGIASLPPPMLGEGIQGIVAAKRRAMIMNDMPHWEGRRTIIPAELQPKTAMAAPLFDGDELFGVLMVFTINSDRKFNEANLQLMQLFAQQATIAIQNARNYATVQRLATTDELTGAWNRRQFMILANRELQRIRRYPSQIALLMFDVDYFKRINDTYGHQVGDQVLIEVIQRCRSIMRTIDVIGRYGGEEFVVLLNQTSEAEARIIAERLRRVIEQQLFQTEAGTIHVTISIGVRCSTGEHAVALDKLLDDADRAMYIAKNNGRNQVWFWDISMNRVE